MEQNKEENQFWQSEFNFNEEMLNLHLQHVNKLFHAFLLHPSDPHRPSPPPFRPPPHFCPRCLVNIFWLTNATNTVNHLVKKTAEESLNSRVIFHDDRHLPSVCTGVLKHNYFFFFNFAITISFTYALILCHLLCQVKGKIKNTQRLAHE